MEQSRKVWIPQLLRTSKSSTQEVYFYHLLSVFHVKDSSDWTLDTVPEGRVFALVLSSGSIQLRLCYNESDNMLQSCQIRQVEPPIWCHLISLYRYTAYSLRFLCRPFDIHDILCNYPLGVPRQELWADLAECRHPKIWQVVHLLVLFVFGVFSNVCPGQLIHCSESQIPRLFPQSNWMRSC